MPELTRNPRGSGRPSPADLAKAARIYRERVQAWDRRELDLTPWLAPCVCGHGMHAHTGPTNTGKCQGCDRRCGRYRANVVDRLVQRIIDGVSTSFTDNLARREAEEYAARPKVIRGPGEWSVRASDLDGCVKALWYRNAPPDGYTPVPKNVGAKLAGTVIEAAVVQIDAGLYPWRQFQRQVEIKGATSPGFIDEWDPAAGRVIDVKSVSGRSWDRVEEYGPPRRNKGQVHLYGAALEAEGEWVSEVALQYIHKETYEERAYVWVWNDDARAFAEECRDDLVGHQSTLDTAAKTRQPPEREGTGPDRFPCRFCDAREHCWNVEAARTQGRTPESLTLLGALNAANIQWAAERVLATRQVRDAAQEAYDAANALIDWSVPLTTYGPTRIVSGQPPRINNAQYAKDLYEEAERHNVDLSHVPIPKTKGGKPIVKAVKVKPDTVPDPPRGEART